MSTQDDNYRDSAPPPLPSQRDDAFEPQDDRDHFGTQPPKKGGCSKGCMYSMAGCGCLSVLVIIGLGVLAWRFVGQSFSVDPAVIQAASKEMADFEPPADLKPKMKMGIIVGTMVMYGSDDDASMLMMMQIDKLWLGNKPRKPGEFPPEFRNGMGNNPQGPNQRELDVVKSEQREIKIRGEVSKVTFAEAKDSNSGKEYRMVKGTFEGNKGPVEFTLQVPEEKYKEKEVVKFLEGIK